MTTSLRWVTAVFALGLPACMGSIDVAPGAGGGGGGSSGAAGGSGDGSGGGSATAGGVAAGGSGGGGGGATAPPTIASFTGPAQVTSGKTATLSWSVVGATSLSLALPNATAVTVAGSSHTTGPLSAAAPTAQTFTLNATNAAGTSSRSLTLMVAPWSIGVVTLFTSASGSFDLKTTLPADVVRGGTFGVAMSGTALPGCLDATRLSQGVLSAGTCAVMPDTTGVTFTYDEP